MILGRGARDKRPYIKPVERIQLSEGNVARRAIVAVLFLIIGAGTLAYSFSQLFAVDAGWQTIQAETSDGPNCGEDFTLLYELGVGNQSVTAEKRALAQIYTRACKTAFQLFHTVQSFEGVTNLHDINARPNEAVTVDPALYAAFEAVRAAGNRTVYLGPVCARYGDLFTCQDDSQLVDFDPWTSREVSEEYAAVATYAADPAHVDVELLGENQVRLRVSEEYLAYASQESIERFLDFGWMKNAFVADYLADTLVQAGYTRGILSSFDGFARCLDDREGTFTLNLYGWEEGRPVAAGTMEYQGPLSIAGLCSFPVTEGDWQRFYQLRDGQLRTPYLDGTDGKCRQSVDSLVCWSEGYSCARLALTMAPVFVVGQFEPAPLEALTAQGVYALWCQDRVFDGTGPLTDIQNLYHSGGVRYSLAEP